MKKIQILLFLGILISIGCKPVIKIIYGIKKPEAENVVTLGRFRKKAHLEKGEMIILKYDNWENRKVYDSPDVFVFNKDGKYIPYKDPKHSNCNGPAEVFISQLDKNASYEFSKEYDLDSFVIQFEKPGCNKFNFEKKDNVDFYIFMTWVSFSGKKIYKEKTNIWLDSLQNNHSINYKLFMLNEDIQDCWSKAQKESLGM